ncbi:MAG: PDZ domain-containing protein [Synergistaceae bacterium]|nr:PDZ domain-containing protein [Synergistaceae bacterium]
MRKILLSALVLCLIAVASSAFAANDDEYVILDVEAEGKNRSEAIEAAWVEGIRQAVGSFVDAKTELNDDQLTERIIEYNRAIVDKYEITGVDDSKADDGIYKLKMRVWIVREILRDGANHATGGEAVISLTPSDFKKKREESGHKELEAKNAAAVTQQAKAKSAAKILEAMLDRYKPEDFLTCYIPGKPEPVKDKQDFFTLNVEINFNEKLYKEAFVPDLIQVLDQIASVKKNTLLSKYKKELRDLAAKKELTKNVKDTVFFNAFISKVYVLSVYNKPERFGARLYGFKDSDLRGVMNALGFFITRTQRFKGIVVDFIDEDKEVMETIEKKFELLYLMTKYLDTVSIHPSILRVSGNTSIESTKVVIPVELEMPEEILPYVKNIKASLLLEPEPIRNSLGGWLGIQVSQGMSGVVVDEFFSGSPAMNSPMITKDIITAINGQSIKTVKDFNTCMSKTRPGQTITVKYRHSDQERQIVITLGEKP